MANPGRAIELRAAAEPLEVLGAPDLLAQLLDKLVENALAFAARDTPVLVSLVRHGRTVALSVSNRGRGCRRRWRGGCSSRWSPSARPPRPPGPNHIWASGCTSCDSRQVPRRRRRGPRPARRQRRDRRGHAAPGADSHQRSLSDSSRPRRTGATTGRAARCGRAPRGTSLHTASMTFLFPVWTAHASIGPLVPSRAVGSVPGSERTGRSGAACYWFDIELF